MWTVIKKRGWIVLGVVAAVAAFAAVAQAAVASSSGIINACYKNNNGDLRVVDGPANCKNNETALYWNQQGIQGAPGAQGEPGPAGNPGISGYEVMNFNENRALPINGRCDASG